ncbi:MAG: hypothetical protein CMN81_04245 [Spongiibacter sp.]|nr:hypothetical protein [Spongiibacter sp.]
MVSLLMPILQGATVATYENAVMVLMSTWSTEFAPLQTHRMTAGTMIAAIQLPLTYIIALQTLHLISATSTPKILRHHVQGFRKIPQITLIMGGMLTATHIMIRALRKPAKAPVLPYLTPIQQHLPVR